MNPNNYPLCIKKVEKISNKLESSGYGLGSNPQKKFPISNNLFEIDNPRTSNSTKKKVSIDQKNFSEPYNLNFPINNSTNNNNKKEVSNHTNKIEINNEPKIDNIVLLSKPYQELSAKYANIEAKFHQQLKEICNLKQENTILQNESKSLKFELRKVVEIRHQEKIQTDLKLKDLEKRFKRMIENKQLTRPNPNHISQSQNTSHKENFLRNRSDENLPQKLNQEIFDIKDSKELSSLLLAMELQSETLPEIDGVPLNIYLSSINENNKIIDIFQESQYDEFNNGNEINPDHMTYEQMLDLGDQIGKVSKGLTEEEINESLKKIRFFKGNMKTNQESCTICLKEFFNGDFVHELVVCKHIYHLACIKEWLEYERVCPNCKKTVI